MGFFGKLVSGAVRKFLNTLFKQIFSRVEITLTTSSRLGDSKCCINLNVALKYLTTIPGNHVSLTDLGYIIYTSYLNKCSSYLEYGQCLSPENCLDGCCFLGAALFINKNLWISCFHFSTEIS